ncbi:hypothetical protein BOC52_11775 [Burkholderia pseudomallei]|nr:hypothetical protein BOC52_11775 [Burkholderia pseudomallei]ARL64175.1 hypothetical protein BOC53_12385 [Burkholderia pseudomallei]
MAGEVVAVVVVDGVLYPAPCHRFADHVFVVHVDMNHRDPRWVVIARSASGGYLFLLRSALSHFCQ